MISLKKSLIILLILSTPVIALVFIDNYFSEKSELYIQNEVKTVVTDILSDAIKESIVVNNNELLKFKYDTEGNINSLYIDSNETNQILSSFNKSISYLLKLGTLEESIEEISLPLGMLISRSLFTSIGPDIKIEVLPITSYKTDIVTDLTNYGINNTLFEMYLNLQIIVETIIPLKQTKIEYNTSILLASQILQGEIPYYYYIGEGAIQSLPL